MMESYPSLQVPQPVPASRGTSAARGIGGQLLVAVLVSGFALAVDVFADPAGLDLQGWFKEPPRIRELVARRAQSDGKVKYLLLVADGSNYVVKICACLWPCWQESGFGRPFGGVWSPDREPGYRPAAGFWQPPLPSRASGDGVKHSKPRCVVSEPSVVGRTIRSSVVFGNRSQWTAPTR